MFEKIWKDIGENQEETMPADKFRRYRTETGKKGRNKGTACANIQSEKHVEICGG